MDPRVSEVMQSALQGQQHEFQSLESLAEGKMGSVVDYCFGRNSSNSQRFAECILDKQNKIEEIMKAIQFKTMFCAKKAQHCLTQDKRSVSDCTGEIKKDLTDIITSTKRNIEKL